MADRRSSDRSRYAAGAREDATVRPSGAAADEEARSLAVGFALLAAVTAVLAAVAGALLFGRAPAAGWVEVVAGLGLRAAIGATLLPVLLAAGAVVRERLSGA